MGETPNKPTEPVNPDQPSVTPPEITPEPPELEPAPPEITPQPSFEPYSPPVDPQEPTPEISSTYQTSSQWQDSSFQPMDSMPAPEPMNPLQEIVNFGNSEVVDTAFTYKLLIRGLDIIQNVEQLKDVLLDSKLGVNFEKLKSKIRNGELLIEKLTGAQAAIIAQRLRSMPVEMIWEQKIYE